MFVSVQFSRLRVLSVFGLMAASSLLSQASSTPQSTPESSAANKAQVVESYGKLPLSFEANQGQAENGVKFLSRGIGYSLFLTDSSAVLALTKREPAAGKSAQGLHGTRPPALAKPGKTDVIRMELAGASRHMQVTGAEQLPGTANYFIGNDSAKWHSGVPTYAKVKYADVYPGVDLVYYGNQRQLEYDFVVSAGADPKAIRLRFAGAKGLRVGTDGNLVVTAANGAMAFHKPVVYQEVDGQRKAVAGSFALLAKEALHRL